MTVRVVSDFSEDIRVQVVDWFGEAGVTLPAPDDLERVLFAYFSVRRRLIPIRSRAVTWSEELLRRTLAEPVRGAVERVASEARAGNDLTPRLSRTIMNPDFNDGLLDDWGVHHFHIGAAVEADGFVERDGPLLYVVARPDTIYFLDLLDHTSFADDALIQIIHDNWSHLLAPFRLPGVVPGSLEPQISSADRRKARRRLTMGVQTADGTVYAPPGGGATTSGLSPRVVSAADDLRDRARLAEQWVRDQAEWIRDQINETVGLRLEELRLQFLLMDPLSVFETQTKALLRIPFVEPERRSVEF